MTEFDDHPLIKPLNEKIARLREQLEPVLALKQSRLSALRMRKLRKKRQRDEVTRRRESVRNNSSIYSLQD